MSGPVTGAIPANPSPQVQLILDFFTALCVGDWDQLNALTAEDFVQTINPKSLGFPARNKAEYIKWNQDGFHIFKDFKLIIYDITEGYDSVTVHGGSDAVTPTGHRYNNEYSITYMLTSTPQGHKITREKQFADSHYCMEFFPAEKERLEAAGLKACW